MKNIIFDVSGVFIISDEEPMFKYYARILEKSYEKVRDAYFKFEYDYERGEMTDKEFSEKFFGELNVPIDSEYFSIKLGFKEKLTDVVEFVKEVGENNKIFFITNEGREYWKKVDEKLHIEEMFIDGVTSHEAGVRKPDVKIFNMLVERNNLVASECVFIDDSEKNLAGALELGMKTIHYKNLKQLKEELKKMGIE